MKIRVALFSIVILNLSLLGFPALAEDRATLSLSPSADSFVVGSEFEVSVLLDTAGQAINVMDVIVYFPEDLIEVVGPPTRDGLLPLWQFNYSNEKGEINIVGGERQGGVAASNSEITRIRFKAKKEGKATLKGSSKNSSIILADGLGTKLPVKAGEAYYILVAKPSIVETPVETPLNTPAEIPPLELNASILNSTNFAPPFLFLLQTNFVGILVALGAIIVYSIEEKGRIRKDK